MKFTTAFILLVGATFALSADSSSDSSQLAEFLGPDVVSQIPSDIWEKIVNEINNGQEDEDPQNPLWFLDPFEILKIKLEILERILDWFRHHHHHHGHKPSRRPPPSRPTGGSLPPRPTGSRPPPPTRGSRPPPPSRGSRPPRPSSMMPPSRPSRRPPPSRPTRSTSTSPTKLPSTTRFMEMSSTQSSKIVTNGVTFPVTTPESMATKDVRTTTNEASSTVASCTNCARELAVKNGSAPINQTQGVDPNSGCTTLTFTCVNPNGGEVAFQYFFKNQDLGVNIQNGTITKTVICNANGEYWFTENGVMRFIDTIDCIAA